MGPGAINRATLPQYDRDNGQPGVYGTPTGSPPNNVATALLDKRVYLLRFRVSRPMTILSGAFGLGVVSSVDDSCAVGIYDATLANLLASSAVTAGKLITTVGPRVLALQAPVTLQPQTTYYSAFVCAVGGTAASIGGYNIASASYGRSFQADGSAAAAPTSESLAFTNSSLALPSSIPSPTNGAASSPVIAWREIA